MGQSDTYLYGSQRGQRSYALDLWVDFISTDSKQVFFTRVGEFLDEETSLVSPLASQEMDISIHFHLSKKLQENQKVAQ